MTLHWCRSSVAPRPVVRNAALRGARRNERVDRQRVTEKQRWQPGCSAGRMQLDLHHGLPDSMRQMLLGVAVCVVSVASPPVARAQGDVRVTTLAREDQVLVSFELLGAYTEEIRDVVASGLETTFSFAIELRQPVAFWFDRTIDRVSVAASVRYDGLTGRYRVRRIVDGRVEQVQVVEEEAAVRQLLTNLERLPLFSTRDLETNGDYRVRVRVDRRPRTGWFRWPWDRAAALGGASFTFLP